MRHLPLVALILLVVVAAGAPWLFGRLAEHEFVQAVERLNASSDRVRAELHEYERNYLSGWAVTELTLGGDDGEDPLILRLNTELEHGLTGVRSWTRPDPEQAEAWRALFPDRLPELRLEAHAHGTVRARVRVPAFSWSSDVPVPMLAGSTGEFSDFSSRLRVRRGARLRFQLDWPGATMDVGHSRMTLEGLHLTQRLRPWGETLWTGRGDLQLEQFVIDPILDAPIVFENLALNNEAGVSGDYLDLDWEASLANLSLGEDVVGRQAFIAGVRGFHAPSLDGALSSLIELQTLRRGSGDAEREMELYRLLSERLQKLAAHGGELDLHELLFRLPEGRLEGALHLAYPQLPEAERAVQRSLLEHVTGEAHLIVDRDMLWVLPQSAQAGLARLRRHGLLEESNGEYRLDLLLQGRELMINGEEVLIPPLL